ncbi:hypothetical protein [Bradyrhizobium sp.]
MKWFNAAQAYGFIQPEGGDDLRQFERAEQSHWIAAPISINPAEDGHDDQ